MSLYNIENNNWSGLPEEQTLPVEYIFDETSGTLLARRSDGVESVVNIYTGFARFGEYRNMVPLGLVNQARQIKGLDPLTDGERFDIAGYRNPYRLRLLI